MRRPILTTLFLLLSGILMPLWANDEDAVAIAQKQLREFELKMSVARRQHEYEELGKTSRKII